jgi:geranylgeranyl pyrophosphate synthase
MTVAMPGTLGLTRELITPVLRDLVNRLDPMLRSVVSYHFGWCDERGVTLNSNAGKAIRPSLVLLAAEAAGGQAGLCCVSAPAWYPNGRCAGAVTALVRSHTIPPTLRDLVVRTARRIGAALA